MINWLRKILGIDNINKNLIENNSYTKNQLIKINKSIDNLIPKKEIRKIEIIDSFSFKNEVSNLDFNLDNNISLDKSWSLVTSQNNKSNILSQITGTSSIASSAIYSANGLYTATANTNALMTYGNGSLSSITMNGSKFGNHAGFVSANPAVFTPILAVQFASMLTGQYYFNGLTKQLTAVQKGVNELINHHHNERLAKLRYINSKTNELNNRNFFTTEDYVIIDKLKYDLSIIRYEYLLAAQQEVLNIFGKNNPKLNQEIIEIPSYDSRRAERILISAKENSKKIKKYLSNVYEKSGAVKGIGSLKNLTENSSKKVEKIANKVTESKFFFYSDIALKSEQLYQLLKLLEFKVNLSDKNPGHNRIGKIEELYQSIINFNYDHSIYDEMLELKNDLKGTLVSKVKVHRDSSQINKSKIDINKNSILEPFKKLENALYSKNLIFDDIKELKKGFETPQQILIDNRNETTRIYTRTIVNKK